MLPSKNSTLPVGVLPSDGVTVARKLTDWPSIEGFVEEVTVVVVTSWTTTWARVVTWKR